jgi:phenylpyruvate tautomerase PptA (4-oxalocrotonate tautomerase family)
MPIVTVHALPPADPAVVDRCLSALTEALAGALQQDQQGVWAQWVNVRAMHTGAQRRGFVGHCPVVIIRARAGRHGGVIQAGLRAAAEATSAALGLPLEDVWVHWEELRPGRVFAGGGVR